MFRFLRFPRPQNRSSGHHHLQRSLSAPPYSSTGGPLAVGFDMDRRAWDASRFLKCKGERNENLTQTTDAKANALEAHFDRKRIALAGDVCHHASIVLAGDGISLQRTWVWHGSCDCEGLRGNNSLALVRQESYPAGGKIRYRDQNQLVSDPIDPCARKLSGRPAGGRF